MRYFLTKARNICQWAPWLEVFNICDLLSLVTLHWWSQPRGWGWSHSSASECQLSHIPIWVSSQSQEAEILVRFNSIKHPAPGLTLAPTEWIQSARKLLHSSGRRELPSEPLTNRRCIIILSIIIPLPVHSELQKTFPSYWIWIKLDKLSPKVLS